MGVFVCVCMGDGVCTHLLLYICGCGGWVCVSVFVCVHGVGSSSGLCVTGAVCLPTEAASASTGPPALAFRLSNDQWRLLWLAGG